MGRHRSTSEIATLDSVIIPESLLAAFDAIGGAYICAPPDAIKTAPHAYAQIMCDLHAWWDISLCWAAYEIFPCIDIYRKPFNTEVFRRLKPMGRYCFQILQLIKGCYEIDGRYRQNYKGLTPWGIWQAIMLEMKRKHLEQQCLPVSGNPVGRRKQAARNMLNALKSGDVEEIAILLGDSPHTIELMKSAVRCHSKGNRDRQRRFTNSYWAPFIESIRGLRDSKQPIKELRPKPNKDELLCIQGRGHQRAIAAEPITAKNTIYSKKIKIDDGLTLKIHSSRTKWSDIKVYKDTS